MQLSEIKRRLADIRQIRSSIMKELNFDYSQLDEDDKSTTLFTRQFNRLKNIKMACIMDEFTYNCFRYECDLLQITPSSWQQEMDLFKPDVFFIESAWRGKDELWNTKVAHLSEELIDAISYCKLNNIPVVFWNKEDPVHFDTFIETAKYVDFVFTTDFDCISRYKSILGHNEVYLLPFAAQPFIHNPIEEFERKDKFSFAGAYYKRYPERATNLETIVDVLSELHGVDIFDRNYYNNDVNYHFPKKYKKYILGNLKPTEINVAYKGYKYSVNMNSVKYSQSMCARRVFELLASNTVTISNYSRAVRNFFGDLVICSDDRKFLYDNVVKLQDETYYKKLRLLGLRKVMREHLYVNRLSFIINSLFDNKLSLDECNIYVIAKVNSQEEYNYIYKRFKQQSYEHKRLVVLSRFAELIPEDNEVTVVRKVDLSLLSHIQKEKALISFFSVHDYYGRSYLEDFVLANRYSSYDEVSIKTKASYYINQADEVQLRIDGPEYIVVPTAKLRNSVIHSKILSIDEFNNYINDIDNSVLHREALSLDSFNYCMDIQVDSCPICDDLYMLDQGIGMDIFESQVNNIYPKDIAAHNKVISIQELAQEVEQSTAVKFNMVANDLVITSTLEASHEYIYINKHYPKELFDVVDQIDVLLEIDYVTKMSVELVVVCYDSNDKKLESFIKKANRPLTIQFNKSTDYFKLGFRVVGQGECNFKQIILGQIENETPLFIPKAETLLITNQYPSYENLYRYPFVHSRIIAYKNNDLLVDVFRYNEQYETGFSEFSGIDVYTGGNEQLQTMFQCNYKTLLIHFLDKKIWDGIKHEAKGKKIIVWLHGSDIQPWWRRMFNFKNEAEVENAKPESNERMAFWNEIFEHTVKGEYDFHFVFVSHDFRNQVFEDYKLSLPEDKYSVIHNFTDSDRYTYEEKQRDARLKILSIRPFSSNVYANDLTVKAILELSKESFFKELKFKIVGQGVLFEQQTKPIKKYKNVQIEETFLRHDEIANAHKHYGVFLVPTRQDTQGVSRDEAMSSGLVPITTNITAIPEFVDENSGILTPPEDYKALAEGIKTLYYNPELFSRLSYNAAQRVRQQSSFANTILKEVELIKQK